MPDDTTGSGGVAAVPDEAVEAAAKDQYERLAEQFARVSWARLSEDSRDAWRVTTAKVLAAAAPVFRAAVLREAADELTDTEPWSPYSDWRLGYRSAVEMLRCLAAGGSPEVDNNESEQR